MLLVLTKIASTITSQEQEWLFPMELTLQKAVGSISISAESAELSSVNDKVQPFMTFDRLKTE
jgi:hypothetical protein